MIMQNFENGHGYRRLSEQKEKASRRDHKAPMKLLRATDQIQ